MMLTDAPEVAPERTDSTPNNRRGIDRYVRSLSRFSGIYIWAAIILIFAIWIPDVFLTELTLYSIAGEQVVTVILALGLIFTLAAGGFDLSIGQNLGMSAIIVATLSTVGGWNPWASAAAAVAISTAVGVVNGFLVARIGVNSLIATLGMTSILLAATRVISDQQFRGPLPDPLRSLTNWKLFNFPGIVAYAIVGALIAWYVLEHTPFGRRTYATGAGPDAAYLAGVRTKHYVFLSFVISGFGAGVAGVLVASKIGSVGPDIGPSYLLPAFAACFLGTTQFKIGRFNIWGTVLAILLLATGVKGLQLVGGELWITDAFNGVVLIGAVSVAVITARRAATGRLG